MPPLATPLNNAGSTLAADYFAGSDALVLKAGSGALFGNPSAEAPIRITVARRSTLAGGQIVAGTAKTIFLCSSRTGDTLSGLTAIEDTTDQDFTRNDPAASLITAGTITEIQAIATAGSPDAVLTTQEYDDPSWLTGVDAAKVAGTLAPTNLPESGVTPATVGIPVSATVDQYGRITSIDSDPNFARTAGANALKTDRSDHILHQFHNVSEAKPTTGPWTETINGEFTGGLTDNVHTEGYPRSVMPAGYPGWTYNTEMMFAPGDPRGANTLETHKNYQSIDGTVQYRVWSASVYCDRHDYCEEYRVWQSHWYNRLGSIPLLLLQTDLGDGGGDGGQVTIANDGSGDPLHVVSAGSGLITFVTGSTGGLAISNAEFADVSNTTRSSPAIAIQGYQWNGSASVGVGTTFQHVVDTETTSYLKMLTGGANAHYYTAAGKVGFNLSGLNYLSENLVIPYGNYGMVKNDASGTTALIGLDASSRVVVSPGGQAILLGANAIGSLGALFGATSGQRGILDARGAVWIGAPASTHGLVDCADGIYINADANGTGSNPIIFAHGRNAYSGGTEWLKLVMDGGANRAVATTPATAPTDAILGNGQVTFYLDEAGNNLKVRVRYSNGTLKTGTVALT